jgi:hypothetical protein
MQRQNLGLRFLGQSVRVTQGDGAGGTTAFCSEPTARVIDEHSAHALGSNAEELRSVLPRHTCRIDEPEICLVDECRGLERVPGTFVAHRKLRLPPELRVNDGQQCIKRLGVASAPGEQ